MSDPATLRRLLDCAVLEAGVGTLEFLLQNGAADVVRENPISSDSLLALLNGMSGSADVDQEAPSTKLLVSAVSTNDCAKVECLLEHLKFPLTARQKALRATVLSDHTNVPMVRVFLEKFNTNANFVSDTSSSNTLLHEAVKAGKSPKIIQLLIAHKADVNAKNNQEETPLHLVGNQHKIASFLIKKGSLPNALSTNVGTPLHVACRNGNVEVAKALTGASPNIADSKGCSPLHHAIQNNHSLIASWLVDKAGADIERCPPFFHMTDFSRDSFMMPNDLIKLGIDPFQVNDRGDSSLHYCVSKEAGQTTTEDDELPGGDGRIQFLDELIRNAPDLLKAKNYRGMSPLHLAVLWNSCLVDRLVKHGVDLNVVDNVGRTPLTTAIVDDCPARRVKQILVFMNEREVSLEKSDKHGWNALHWAVFLGNVEHTQLLVEFGSQVNTRNICGRTPLHLFGYPFDKNENKASLKDKDVTRVVNTKFQEKGLASLKADKKTKNARENILKLLLSRGADATALDEFGNLPFFMLAATSSCLSAIFLVIRTAGSQGLFDKVVPDSASLKRRACAPEDSCSKKHCPGEK